MNFDYTETDVKLRIRPSLGKNVFEMQFEKDGRFLETVGMNSDGLFVSSQFLYPEISGKTDLGRKLTLSLSLVLNLGLLVYFKYANFFVGQAEDLLGLLGQGEIPWREIALPIGISFFTFQKLSYMIDVYRGLVPPARSFRNYALYVALFPQLIAGPIIRYHDVAEQLERRTHSAEKFFEGVWRFSLGLGKKVLIANPLAQVADTAFSQNIDTLPTFYAWIGILAYSFQIYFDFSGYSDMAIGLGRMMGFTFLENFNRPYIARNFTEFWRRWHISLSNWMREYLYIPLGGNRAGGFRVYVNLWIVFLLSGLWHGASWNFVVWGAFHGFFPTLDKLPFMKWMKKLPAVVSTPYTFLLVTISWVFFRAETIEQAWAYLCRMFYPGMIGARFPGLVPPAFLSHRAMFILVLGAIISFYPERWRPFQQVDSPVGRPTLIIPLKFAGAVLVFMLAIFSLANLDFNPFIYFRF